MSYDLILSINTFSTTKSVQWSLPDCQSHHDCVSQTANKGWHGSLNILAAYRTRSYLWFSTSWYLIVLDFFFYIGFCFLPCWSLSSRSVLWFRVVSGQVTTTCYILLLSIQCLRFVFLALSKLVLWKRELFLFLPLPSISIFDVLLNPDFMFLSVDLWDLRCFSSQILIWLDWVMQFPASSCQEAFSDCKPKLQNIQHCWWYRTQPQSVLRSTSTFPQRTTMDVAHVAIAVLHIVDLCIWYDTLICG